MTDIKENLIFIDLFTNEFIVIETDKENKIKKNKTLYTESQKKAIYKWRENNREKYNEMMKPYKEKYYYSNKEKIAAKYLLKKEMIKFMNILL